MNRAALERLLAGGKDNALLRFTLGGLCAKDGDHAAAARHFAAAVAHDPTYSAAWKGLGHAHAGLDDPSAARSAWQRGLQAAEARGDAQSAKEMTVFLRRLDKQRKKRDA